MPKAGPGSASSIDSLTSPTLKHLRERWWDDEFTEFLAETLRPRPGNRILDVGCGEGLAEVSIGRLHLSQIVLVGVDLALSKVQEARRQTAGHNQRVGFAAGDAVRLPFRDGVFDSTYCVAVLQHVDDVEAAVGELARVTRGEGRVVAVEPDSTTRYGYSSLASGAAVFDAAGRLFASVTAGRASAPVGPRLPELFWRHRIEPVEVRLFPVSLAFIGAPPAQVWHDRRSAIARLLGEARQEPTRALAATYLDLLSRYELDAGQAGPACVEIQNTLLFATVGQKR
jgi:SAM-dependent methyltransferase